MYALDHYETMDADHAGKVKVLPLQSPKKFVIAGLGTEKVTAQGDLYVFSKETQIYPLNSNRASWVNDSKWYYTSFGNQVCIIQIEGDAIKVHELGGVPDTLAGTRVK
jgi:hypothetical protein